jgi:diguanylate cyclase (GGDEF)-like protein/PAS domain S-box-containing protein
VRAVEDAQGEVLGWSVSARDITEQKRLADALAQQVHLYSAIARSLPGGAVTVFDRELLFVTAEGELLETLGVDKHQLVGKSLAEHSTAANRDSLLHLYRRALEGVSTEIEAERAGRLLLIRVAPLHDAHGAISGGMVLSLDVTAQRRQALLLRTIAENVPNSAIAVFDRALRITYAAGHKLYEAAHCGPEQLEGKSLGALTGEDRQSLYRATFDGEIVTDEQTRFGRVFELRALPIRDLRGEIASGLLLIYDVSARRDEAEELRRAKLLLEATIANMQDGVSLLDVDKRILLANDAYASLFGRSREDLVGLGPTDFFALVASRFEQPELFGELLRAQAQSSVELVLRLPRRRVLRRTITAVGGHGAGGQAVGEQGCGPESPSAGKSVAGTSQAGYLVVWQDVTADSDMREQRRHEAMTDALTGIANRRAAQAALESAVAQRSDPNVPLSVALFDIDHFKRINDLHGHPFGDAVIREVARVLAAQTRTNDLAARWGGEEFIAIIAATREGATAFCERVRAAVRALSCPELAGLTISAGVATRTANESAHALIKRADEQLYRAKGSGRDRVSW